jgi:hypothetical protein
MDYNKLVKRTSISNAPGIKKKVLVAPRSYFAASGGLQEPSATPATMGDQLKITTDHTFETGKGWMELYTTLDTGELTGESVGDRDSRTTNPKVEAKHPGLYAEALAFGEMAKGDEFIVLVEQLDGTFLQLGQDGLECDITYSFSSGKVSGGYNGITFSIESFGPVFIYTGVITMKPVATTTTTV